MSPEKLLSDAERVTRCRRWYELNLGALRFREIRRAVGWWKAPMTALMFGITRRLGTLPRTRTLFPEDVTVIWDVPLDQASPPPELEALGFTPLVAFELPEFSGENVTCLFADPERKVYCELSWARGSEDMEMSNFSFSSYFPGLPRHRLKTVSTWHVVPLDQPAGFRNRKARGGLAAVYRAHRRWLATVPEQPTETTRANFFTACHEDHRVLCDLYVARQVYVPAQPEDVARLLIAKGLRRAPETRDKEPLP